MITDNNMVLVDTVVNTHCTFKALFLRQSRQCTLFLLQCRQWCKKSLENCNQVKVSLLTKKPLELKYEVLTKKST